jgi:hypothetical protein
VRVNLLHIRKTGGNAVQHALRPYAAGNPVEIVRHPHATRLPDIPMGNPVCFMLRDPVDRFVSGFNSRRRCGRPLKNRPWNEAERIAFAVFPTANDLAEALSAPEDLRRAEAVAAMSGINHVNSCYADWLVDTDYVRSRRDDIIWVGLTSCLDDDFERLKGLLNLSCGCVLPSDPVAAHRRLETDEIHLSSAGHENVKR